ncbi:MAG: efflux RND transporter permease subunit [Longimicrobiales bacterium]|nr:efflux RND transporter permease subunit [Longimicrobiales bacterium]
MTDGGRRTLEETAPGTPSEQEWGEVEDHGGPVAFMAKHKVAANLLMVVILAAGLVSLGVLVQEVFPEFSLDTITVSVPYPGATPEEVEESIILKIEEQIQAIEGVDEITSTAAEGVGTVALQLEIGAEVQEVLDDVKAEIDQINTFPTDAERPDVRELTNRQSVIKLAIYGDVDERTLKEIAYRTEDALGELDEVSFVETSGVREYEISIEVEQSTLRALGLTLGDVSRRVAAGSLDLSAGSIETSEEEVRVRTLGQNYDQGDFERIVVISRSDGTVVRLGDIASVTDGFIDAELVTRYNGRPAALVEVYRTSDERVLEIVAAVEAALDDRIVPNLPPGVSVEIWNNEATILEDRLQLMVKNAALGLLLVLIALTLFLELGLALWVAVGIGLSFVGTLAVMLMLGVSINVMSLFGFILAVGIVVDDAIVVGENIYAEREQGVPGLLAAIRGAKRITGPVTFAVLTTITAFSPLLFVPGAIGKILGAIPVIVISVLALSLVESLFILPHHLSHLAKPHQEGKNRVTRLFSRLQNGVDRRLKRFVEGPLDRGLRFATAEPAVVISSGVALIILSVAMVPAGLIPVEFFPAVEGDNVIASLEMPEGTAAARTREAVEEIRAAARRAEERLADERPADAPPLVEAVYSVVGELPPIGGPVASVGTSGPMAHVAHVDVRLLKAEDRSISAARFEEAWRQEVGNLGQARSLSFSADVVNIGAPVQVELSHPDPERLRAYADQVVDELEEVAGVFDVKTDQDEGLREIQLRLTAEARTLGLTLEDVARQVRAAFFGSEALRVQRGREDVSVYVRLPATERNAMADVGGYRIRTPLGGYIPLERVAEVSFGNSPTAIRRKDGRRILTVTGDVDPAVITGQEATSILENEIIPALAAEDARLGFTFGGEQQEQREAFASVGRGFLFALLTIYALLAIPFSSYVQPLIIMAAIPFGIVGAFLAHLGMGLSLGLLSLFGIIGLSGVVVNDSLVMIDFINERRQRGMEARQAIIDGAKARFRPILLTSITTFLGVAPLVFEQSLQAQFLIPMAASLAFGILFATAILMLVVPALATIQADAQEWWASMRTQSSSGEAVPEAIASD